MRRLNEYLLYKILNVFWGLNYVCYLNVEMHGNFFKKQGEIKLSEKCLL